MWQLAGLVGPSLIASMSGLPAFKLARALSCTNGITKLAAEILLLQQQKLAR